MATINEDYVSFEVSKLLKEKGFKGDRSNFYERGRLIDFRNYWWRITPKERYEAIEAPTIQMARKWLRIEHNIHVEPHAVKTKHSYGYMPSYIDLKELKQHFPFDEFDFSNADKYVCITYDKACEVTIKYCLEHLI